MSPERDDHAVLAATRRRWASRLALPIGMLALVGVARLTPSRECTANIVGSFVQVVLPASVPDAASVQVCLDDACQPARARPPFNDGAMHKGSWYAEADLSAPRVTVRVVVAEPAIDAAMTVRPRATSVNGGCHHPRAVRLRYDPAAAALVTR